MLGYYGTHFMIILEGMALLTLNLYRPRMRDLLPAIATALLILLVIFCIDLLMRVSGLYPKANYFYAMETEGNFLLEKFHSWIPYPGLYLLPCFGILLVWMLVITIPFAIAGRGEQEDEEEPD